MSCSAHDWSRNTKETVLRHIGVLRPLKLGETISDGDWALRTGGGHIFWSLIVLHCLTSGLTIWLSY